MDIPAFFIIDPNHFSTGAEEMLRTISTVDPISFEISHQVIDKGHIIASWLCGCIGDFDRPHCYLFAHSGNQHVRRSLEILREPLRFNKRLCHIRGYVLLVDSKKTEYEQRSGNQGHRVYDEKGRLVGWEWDSPIVHQETYYGVDAMLAVFRGEDLTSITPLMVAVLNQHLPDAMPLEEIRQRLPNPEIKMVACDVQNKVSIKNLLLELLNSAPDDEFTSAARQILLGV